MAVEGESDGVATTDVLGCVDVLGCAVALGKEYRQNGTPNSAEEVKEMLMVSSNRAIDSSGVESVTIYRVGESMDLTYM